MGRISVLTGEHGGKTTAALGVALRAVGQGKKVIFIQFMKGRKDIGEWKIRKKLGVNFEMHQFGTKGWIDLKNPSEKDIKIAKKGFEFAKKCLTKKPFLIILDEINLAVNIGLLNKFDVLDFMKSVDKKTNLIMTGRHADDDIMKRADYVKMIIDLKHPKEIETVKGLEY